MDRRSRERAHWSDIGKYSVTFHLRGWGEGKASVDFGRAFSSPPTMNHSAVMDYFPAEVVPSVVVPPRGSLDRDVDPNGLGNDSQVNNDIIADPGFEGQAQWASLYPEAYTIPTTSHAMRLLYEAIENGATQRWPLSQAYNSSPPPYRWAEKVMYGYDVMSGMQGAHQWVQTDDHRERWSITSAAFHDLGIGEAGKHSAHTTIGADGYTNWLIPIDRTNKFWQDIVLPSHAQYAEHFFSTCYEGAGEWYYGEPYFENPPPPFLGGFDGFAYLKSDQNCSFESKAVYHHWDGMGVDKGDPSEIVFTGEASYYGNWLFEPEKRAPYRLVASVENSTDVEGGGWKRLEIDLPYSGKRAYPKMVEETADYEGTLAKPYWRLMFRVKGTPGTKVYLDNIFVWRELRNQLAPLITVGVERWVLDDAGAYIGADLWFKVGMPDSVIVIPGPMGCT